MSYADTLHLFLFDSARPDFAQAGAYQVAAQIFGSTERNNAERLLRVLSVDAA